MTKCRVCNGKGQVNTHCTTCGGKGRTRVDLTTGRQLLELYACHDCGNFRCVACGGDGLTPQPARRIDGPFIR
jgi:RecJ-like exonuclease